MKLCELLLKSRSVRSFVPGAPVPPEVLRQMIDATRLCPSSANLQALKFRPVTHETECRKVFDSIKWAGYLPAGTLPPKGHESTAYVVICLDKCIASNVSAFNKDTGICAQTMMLCAAELGYGGCMIGSFDGEKLKSALKLGENLEITLVLALGVPDEAPVIVESTGDIKYYRDNGVQYVPKRSLDEITIK